MVLALLLDLDGTLMDTLEVIVASMNSAAEEFDVESFRVEELRPMIGTPVQRQLDELRGITGPRADAFADGYYEHFTRHVGTGLRLFPGVRETFPRLAERAICTMSTRRREEARHMLQVTGLDPYFRAIVGGDDVSRPKPNPDLPLLAAKALHAVPSECVVVGDSPVDILAGRAARCWTIAAAYGYGNPAALHEAKPHATVARFEELPRVLEELDGLASRR